MCVMMLVPCEGSKLHTAFLTGECFMLQTSQEMADFVSAELEALHGQMQDFKFDKEHGDLTPLQTAKLIKVRLTRVGEMMDRIIENLNRETPK